MKEKIARSFCMLGLSVETINAYAKDKLFKKRKRILDAFDFLFALLVNANKETVSYNTMASTLGLQKGKAVSKQALHKAMTNKAFVDFINEVFNKLFSKKLEVTSTISKYGFQRIIIQDSTVIKLPQRLAAFYSGVKNGFTQVVNARIQYAFDILSSCGVYFEIDPYSINDQKAAKNLNVRKGDLILRDRGYFNPTEVNRLLNNEADFIYRYKHRIVYYDVQTGARLDLLKILSLSNTIDMNVRMGKKGAIIRIVAQPVSEELANQRRAQAKKSAKTPPSKLSQELLSWSIFLTTIPIEKADFKAIFELYSLRWRVETIFKGMKSHLKLDRIHNVSNTQLKFIIVAKMILFLLVFQFIFSWFSKRISKHFHQELSLLKLCRYLKDNVCLLPDLLKQVCANRLQKHSRSVTMLLLKYCTYDKKKCTNES